MVLPDDFWCRNDTERALLSRAADLADGFARRATAHDRDGSFPHENFAELRAADYLALTVPVAYGGGGGGVFAMTLGQERLARGDGSTALGVGWHLFTLGKQAQASTWAPEVLNPLFAAAARGEVLINAAVSEPATGSPSRGGRPQTTAKRDPDGSWQLDGRKTFTTMAPALTHYIVSATAQGIERTASFLVPRDTAGVRVEETWDAMGMRATGSHDLVLENVAVPASALLEPAAPSGDSGGPAGAEVRGGNSAGWNLHIPAAYLGVARAAADFAVSYAAQRRPNSISGSIADLPVIEQKLGQMQRQLLPAYDLLFSLARRWDEDASARPHLAQAVGVCKLVVMDAALIVVDLAMRVVGGAGLSRSLPLERYYRDVRPGLHNPPMEDAVLTALARQAVRAVQTVQAQPAAADPTPSAG